MLFYCFPNGVHYFYNFPFIELLFFFLYLSFVSVFKGLIVEIVLSHFWLKLLAFAIIEFVCVAF
jgi:hypothetical protein